MATYFVTIDQQEFAVILDADGASLTRPDGSSARFPVQLLQNEPGLFALIEGKAHRALNIHSPAPRRVDVQIPGRPTLRCEVLDELTKALSAGSKQQGARFVRSPMPGLILSIKVSQGQAVKAGDVLLILEAMKTENELCAERDGIVAAIHVQAGQTIADGALLVELDSESGEAKSA